AAPGVDTGPAKDLVANHAPEDVQAKIEVFDWLIETESPRVSDNPPGFLIRSIARKYGTPTSFEPRAERQERRRTEEKKLRARAARRVRTVAEAEEGLAADREPIARYWNSLTPPHQEMLRDRAIAEGDPWLVERYEDQREIKPHLAKHWLKVIIDRYIEKHGLAGAGPSS